MGIIARDFTGNFVAHVRSSILWISMAQYLRSNNFIIQLDNVQVIETMLVGGFSSTSFAAIFDDCRILSTEFGKITFQHCYR
jgi:hypothetical protein